MNEFECEVTDAGDILVRHVRQGHEFFVEASDEGLLAVKRVIKGRTAVDGPDLYAVGALAYADRYLRGRA